MPRLSAWFAEIAGRRFVSIRAKYLAGMVFIILLFGVINMSITRVFVVRATLEEIHSKERLVFSLLDRRLGEMLLARDVASVYHQLVDLKKLDEDILYLVVYDIDGSILGHTFSDGFPKFLLSPPPPGPRNYVDDKIPLYVNQESASILGGGLGTLTVGWNDGGILKRANRVTYVMSGMVALFLLLGVAGALVFSHFITAPVRGILRAYGEFVPGARLPAIATPFNDEMRLLADGFIRMMERINEVTRQFKDTQAKIIETEKLASLGTLAAGLAHEINNPIAGIQMCLRRLQKAIPREAKQSEYIVLISEATGHIRTVVQDLLQYAQSSPREREKADLRTVVADAVKLAQTRLRRGEIRISVSEPRMPCPFTCIRAHLVQVIVNGIINSIDAVGERGNIRIELCLKERFWILSIRDDGRGLTPEIASQAFDPFFTTKGSKGTGLGLYVSYTIVKAHQGGISLQSLPEGGALLEISLPAEERS